MLSSASMASRVTSRRSSRRYFRPSSAWALSCAIPWFSWPYRFRTPAFRWAGTATKDHSYASVGSRSSR